MARRSKADRNLTKYVEMSIVVVLTYTVIELILSTVTGIAHDTLTTCVYGFFGGEVVTCGLIKIFKLKGTDESQIT